MRNDTFEQIWNEVHGHAPAVDSLLVQSIVRDTWREIAEARTWSWLRRKSTITLPAPYVTGTVALIPGRTLATFAGATLTQSMVGRQFRVGSDGAVYDVQSIDDGAGTAQIWPPYSDTDAAVSGAAYKIFTAYIVPPDSDFFAWITVTDPKRRKRLRLHVNQEEIEYYDANRSLASGTSGGPACLSGIDWTASYAGKIYQPAKIVSASGAAPYAGGTYAGQTDSLFIIKITVPGVVGVAQFTYQKDAGAVSAALLSDAAGNYLADGVTITFPTAIAFSVGDTFVVRTSTLTNPGLPRYELYPHPTASMFLATLYSIRVRDIDEAGFVLPYTIPGSVIKTGALAKLARRIPGTDQKPNPFSQVARAQALEEEYRNTIADLITADDYIMETNVSGPTESIEQALLPWMTTSGTGMRSTPEFDPTDMFIR